METYTLPPTIMSKISILAHPDHSLAQHLVSVASRAKTAARHFQGEQHAMLAGLLHDLGKAEDEFQKRINKASKTAKEDGEKQPHAHHGAALALEHLLWPVAFAINGHHAGLHNRADLQQIQTLYIKKAQNCSKKLENDPNWDGQQWPVTDWGKTLPVWLDQLPSTSRAECAEKMRAVDFYTRMLFSALVDADRLDTEESNSSTGSQASVAKRTSWRYGEQALAAKNAPEELLEKLKYAISKRAKAAQQKNASQQVLSVRSEVLEACKSEAKKPRGVFSLCVPTGGGKTLSSVAFALEHIKHHHKESAEGKKPFRRIIIVIPYLNIIQQTTKELKEVFEHTEESPIILEHHSQASDPEIKSDKNQPDTDGFDKERPLRQLAAENWDAPIIVTTSVQFFDSLFSRRPADARKLHNICQSVIIFDEVQTLPPSLLQPILDALKELTSPKRPYGCSAVLCTATQPALAKSDALEFGFENITPITSQEQAKNHFRQLSRVEYRGLSKHSEPDLLSNENLANTLLFLQPQQALVIFNTRKQARALFDKLRDQAGKNDQADESLKSAIFHLSTWMYPAHRIAVLKEVIRRLEKKEPCLLVSTQCVEAGVDVDFPVVYRAFGPYDSIVQAAGRCNRNGALKDSSGNPTQGKVIVFTPEDDTTPQGVYTSAIETARLLRKMDKAKPEDPDSFALYFRLLYQTSVPDPGGCAVQSARENLHFKEVSEIFRFIEADTAPLLIGDAKMEDETTVEDFIKETKKKTYLTPDEWRKIQPYIVNLSFPAGKEVQDYFAKEDCELVFNGDDPIRGLRLLKTGNQTYTGGLNGAGLNLCDKELDMLL